MRESGPAGTLTTEQQWVLAWHYWSYISPLCTLLTVPQMVSLPTSQWNRHWSLFPQDTDHLTHSYTKKKYYYNTPTDSSFSDHAVNCIFSQTVLKWSMGGMGGVIGGFSQRQKACLLHSLNTMASSTVQYNSHMLISATPIKFTTTHGSWRANGKADFMEIPTPECCVTIGLLWNFTHKRLILSVSENWKHSKTC